MPCPHSFLGICFVPVKGTASLFGFKDFIAALALLVIVYTLSDIRYQFRLSVAPTSLLKTTYWLTGLIGFATLGTDIWISEKWPVPDSLISTAIWQGIFAALFLGFVMTWMYYAFINPPIFGRANFAKYANELYRIVLKGSEAELPTIAHELARSANSLVTLASDLPRVKANSKGNAPPSAEGYAHDMLLLIANRKFCRHLVASSPMTAIQFLETVSQSKAYHVPIGPFVQNVSSEAIRHKDSALYHEDDGYQSGLLGYIKPLSRALYGNYELAEALGTYSPLDIDYESVRAWDAIQFKTYCRATQLTLQSFLSGGRWRQHSYVLSRAMRTIQEAASRAISDISDAGADYNADAHRRLDSGVDFMKDSVNLVCNIAPPPESWFLRRRRDSHLHREEDLYDEIAASMFQIISSAGYIGAPLDKAWSVQFNSVWADFLENFNRERPWRIVQFKLRRLLYDEICRLEVIPNYLSARVLGVCLNVMGLAPPKRTGNDRASAALKEATLQWVRRHYLDLREINADVADACLIGGITFDAAQSRLVKTYSKGLASEPAREYLLLDRA